MHYSYSYDHIVKQLQYYNQKIVSLTAKNAENEIMQRYELKQYKRDIKQLKYSIFLIRTSPLKNITHINELKNKLVFLKDEKENINIKFSNLYVENVRELEFCYGERRTFNMLLQFKQNQT